MPQLQSGGFVGPGIPRTAAATAFRAAALHHKWWAFDDAVEIEAIVEAITGQKDEIVDRGWRFFGEQLNVEFAPTVVKCATYVLLALMCIAGGAL
jgi:hypothetical protein